MGDWALMVPEVSSTEPAGRKRLLVPSPVSRVTSIVYSSSLPWRLLTERPSTEKSSGVRPVTGSLKVTEMSGWEVWLVMAGREKAAMGSKW